MNSLGLSEDQREGSASGALNSGRRATASTIVVGTLVSSGIGGTALLSWFGTYSPQFTQNTIYVLTVRCTNSFLKIPPLFRGFHSTCCQNPGGRDKCQGRVMGRATRTDSPTFEGSHSGGDPAHKMWSRPLGSRMLSLAEFSNLPLDKRRAP